MENEVKYRNLIVEALNEEATLVRQKMKSAINIKKDLISARTIIEKLKFNENGQYIAETRVFSVFTSQMFKNCMLKANHEGLRS